MPLFDGFPMAGNLYYSGRWLCRATSNRIAVMTKTRRIRIIMYLLIETDISRVTLIFLVIYVHFAHVVFCDC